MRKFLLVLVCLAVLSASCAVSSSLFPTSTTSSDSNALRDGGFISQKPCGPPCFFGIIPGETTEIEGEQARQNLGNVFVGCETFDKTASGARVLSCIDGVGVTYNKHLVEGVGFSPLEDITVQEVIEKYGPPDQVDVFLVSLPDYPYRVGASLSYDRLQTVLGFPEKDGRDYAINPNSKITSVAYYTKSKYQYLRDATSGGAVPWGGFKTYLPPH
jgi:hypothetical protein